MLTDLVGHKGDSSLDGECREQPRLAARPCAQVEPTLVGSRRSLDLGPRQREHEQLRPLVLHGGPAVSHRVDGAGVALGQDGAHRAEAGALGSEVLELVERERPGTCHERDLGRLVVDLEQRGER